MDNDLNIRRFTDYVSTEFAIMPHDIGRPIKCIAYQFPDIDILEICAKVIKTLIQDDREVVNTAGKVYLMRTAPYRSVENIIFDCVITLVDTQRQS